jgi:hypothetical protein
MKTFKDMLLEAGDSPVDPPRSPDEQNFIDKHIIAKFKHPVAPDDQFTGDIKGSKRKKRLADLEDGEDKKIYEESESEMTPAQKKKREEIVMSLKGKMDEFKSRYGDKAKDVMYATATKMAMKEGSTSKEKEKSPYVDRNSPESKAKVQAARDRMTKDDAAKPGKKLLDKIKMKEEISEGVLEDLQNIVNSKSMKEVKFTDGKKQKVDLTTASKVLSVHKQLNPENKAKVERMLNDSKKFMQIVQFSLNAGD